MTWVIQGSQACFDEIDIKVKATIPLTRTAQCQAYTQTAAWHALTVIGRPTIDCCQAWPFLAIDLCLCMYSRTILYTWIHCVHSNQNNTVLTHTTCELDRQLSKTCVLFVNFLSHFGGYKWSNFDYKIIVLKAQPLRIFWQQKRDKLDEIRRNITIYLPSCGDFEVNFRFQIQCTCDNTANSWVEMHGICTQFKTCHDEI